MKVFAFLIVAAVLALPAIAQADMVTFGSDLGGTPTIEDNHQADVLYFNQPGQPNSTASPVDGEVVAVRLKGTILPRDNNEETKDIDRLFHVQTLKPNGNNSYTVLSSSDSLYFPYNVSPDTISSYRAASAQCVSQGDVVDFNDIGGWQGNAGSPKGTRYQIFRRSPGNNVLWYSKDNGTNIGSTWTTEPPMREQEIMMQVVVATGYDASTQCPGGKKGHEYQGVSISTPSPAPKVYDDGVARARVACPENTFGSCEGTVRLSVNGTDIGSSNFKLGNSTSTNVQIQLTNAGAALVTQSGHVDAVATADSKDGYGVTKTNTGTVTLTSARAPGGTAFVGVTAKAQTVTYKKGKKLVFKAMCPAGTTGGCGGKFSIKSQTRVKLKKTDKGKVYSLGSAKYLIATGQSASIVFKIPSSTLKALKKVKKIVGIATVNSQDTAGHKASKRVKVTFKYKG
jgi:hypothetical protein